MWEPDVAATPNTIKVIYDDNVVPTPPLVGVDNIVGSVSGDLGNMELVLLEPTGGVSAFARFLDQVGSELCGPQERRAADDHHVVHEHHHDDRAAHRHDDVDVDIDHLDDGSTGS